MSGRHVLRHRHSTRSTSARTKQRQTKLTPTPELTEVRRSSRSSAGRPAQRFDPTGPANMLSEPRRRPQPLASAQRSLTRKNARRPLSLGTGHAAQIKGPALRTLREIDEIDEQSDNGGDASTEASLNSGSDTSPKQSDEEHESQSLLEPLDSNPLSKASLKSGNDASPKQSEKEDESQSLSDSLDSNPLSSELLPAPVGSSKGDSALPGYAASQPYEHESHLRGVAVTFASSRSKKCKDKSKDKSKGKTKGKSEHKKRYTSLTFGKTRCRP